MNKAVLCVALILVTAACLPLTPAPPAPPVVDNAGTAEAMLKTAIVQTLTAQPTVTPLPSDEFSNANVSPGDPALGD